MSTPDDVFDPFEAHYHREPLPDAGVRVVAMAGADPARAEVIGQDLVDMLVRLGRPAEVVVERLHDGGRNRALERALADAAFPLVLVTSATEPWTEAHLKPLLAAIDECDHVVGRRSGAALSRLGRWLAAWPWRILFAVPVVDVHSPCRLHRREKLAAIPIQSASDFSDVEILAKATFFGHLIDEVKIPPLESARPTGRWGDFLEVFRRPVLVRKSAPAEDAKGEQEGDDGPGGEDRQSRGDGDEARPAQQDHPQGADELGQGQRLDERLEGRREVLRLEEDA